MTENTNIEINPKKEHRNKQGRIVLVVIFILIFLGAVFFCFSPVCLPELILFARSNLSKEGKTGIALLEEAENWELVFFDDFEEDQGVWWVGEDSDEYANYKTTIEDGVYRIDVTAKKGFYYWLSPIIPEVSDFYFSVEVHNKSGSSNRSYGVAFREDDSNNYDFSIYDSGSSSIDIFFDDGWETIKSVILLPQMIDKEFNKITIIAKGSDFYIFINDQFMAYFNDDRLKEGDVGISLGLHQAGDQAVFEFDNFELRVPQE